MTRAGGLGLAGRRSASQRAGDFTLETLLKMALMLSATPGIRAGGGYVAGHQSILDEVLAAGVLPDSQLPYEISDSCHRCSSYFRSWWRERRFKRAWNGAGQASFGHCRRLPGQEPFRNARANMRAHFWAYCARVTLISQPRIA